MISGTQRLFNVCGGKLEKIDYLDKVALISVLSVWLSFGGDSAHPFTIEEAMRRSPAQVSDHFYLYVAIIACPNYALDTSAALALINAISAQLQRGHWHRSSAPSNQQSEQVK